MKRILLFVSLLSVTLFVDAFGQSNQSPVINQSTSTETNRQANPARPKMKKTNRNERLNRESGMDTTLPKDRKQRRLRPDSLRRGGATRVDSVR
ncbi:hypothetical protein [Spirosoma areae]